MQSHDLTSLVLLNMTRFRDVMGKSRLIGLLYIRVLEPHFSVKRHQPCPFTSEWVVTRVPFKCLTFSIFDPKLAPLWQQRYV
jgi:hypothetical protein